MELSVRRVTFVGRPRRLNCAPRVSIAPRAPGSRLRAVMTRLRLLSVVQGATKRPFVRRVTIALVQTRCCYALKGHTARKGLRILLIVRKFGALAYQPSLLVRRSCILGINPGCLPLLFLHPCCTAASWPHFVAQGSPRSVMLRYARQGTIAQLLDLKLDARTESIVLQGP